MQKSIECDLVIPTIFNCQCLVSVDNMICCVCPHHQQAHSWLDMIYLVLPSDIYKALWAENDYITEMLSEDFCLFQDYSTL